MQRKEAVTPADGLCCLDTGLYWEEAALRRHTNQRTEVRLFNFHPALLFLFIFYIEIFTSYCRNKNIYIKKKSHLFDILSLHHILMPHLHARVEEAFDEVSWTDSHQVRGFVSTWRPSSENVIYNLVVVSTRSIPVSGSHFQCHLPPPAPPAAFAWTSCCQSAWWLQLFYSSRISRRAGNRGCPWRAGKKPRKFILRLHKSNR